MTALLTAAAVWAFLMLPVLAICADSKRRDIDAAMRRHPSSWSTHYWESRPYGPYWQVDGFDDDTEAAIEQAIGILDDGKRLADEAEDWLRGLSR